MWLKLITVAITLVKRFTNVPDIQNEAAFRDFCKEIVLALKELVSMTPPEFDDQAVAVLDKIAHTDTYWAAFYRVLLAALDIVNEEEAGPVLALAVDDDGIRECCEDCHCDDHLICQLIQFIAKVWKSLRHK